MSRQHAKTNHSTPASGHQRLTRRRVLALGAAGAGLATLNPMALARIQAMGPSRPAPALNGTLAVLMGSYNPSPTYKQTMKLYQSYERLHPGVSFSYPKGPTSGDEAVQVAWLTTRGLASRLPDIYSAANAIFVDTIRYGWWVDLTPYLDKPNPYVPGNKRWRDLIKPGLLDQGAFYDGRNFMFEADGSNQAFFINKEIFSKAGVKVPATWAELMDVSRAIKRAGFYAFGMPNGQGWTVHNLSQVMESLLWAKEFKKPGSTYILSAVDLLRAIKAGQYNRTDPRNAEAWRLLKDWMPTWYPGSLTAPDYGPFIKGKVAIWMDGTWSTAALKKALGAKLDIMPMPPVTSATSKFASGDTSVGSGDFSAGNPLAISASAQRNGRLDLAVDFLQYYSSPKVIGPLTLEQGLVPMVEGAESPGPLEEKAIKWFIDRPCLFGAASDQLGAELYGAHQNLCTGYLAGSVDLTSALRQLQTVQQRVVHRIIAQNKLKI